jgi:XTP/dITP diphosphohydrolase
MSHKVLFASRNQGKVAEVAALLKPLGWEVFSVVEVPALVALPDPVESGETFAANAELKARFYTPYWSDAILADDSGLEVMALNGFPGVYSNRWSPGSDTDRCAALLEKLEQSSLMTPEQRTAQFVTTLCWINNPQALPEFFTGSVKGTLALHPKGTAGFGYDPLFVPDGFSETFAELGIETKNTMSHRARALQALLTHLK